MGKRSGGGGEGRAGGVSGGGGRSEGVTERGVGGGGAEEGRIRRGVRSGRMIDEVGLTEREEAKV